MAEIMKKIIVLLLFVIAVLQTGSAQQLEKTNWTIGYFLDDFDEKLPQYPFYWLTLDATGKGTETDRISIRISHRGFELVLFPMLTLDRLTGRNSVSKIKMKLSDGTDFDVPFHYNDENIMQADDEAFEDLVNFFNQGNFTIAIIGYVSNSGIRPSLIAKVTNETRQIVPAIRNMQKIWKKHGVFQ